MSKISIDIKGTIPTPDFKKAVKSALSKAGDKAAGYAKSLVPIRKGVLKDKIVPKMIDDETVTIKPDSPTFHLVEHGTKPHMITPRGKIIKYGSNRYSRFINHPGTTAQPFLTPAIQNHQHEYTQMVIDGINEAVNSELKKD